MGTPRWRKGEPSGVQHSMERVAHAAAAMVLLLACQAAGEFAKLLFRLVQLNGPLEKQPRDVPSLHIKERKRIGACVSTQVT